MHFEEGEWDILANELVDLDKSPYKDLQDVFDFNDVLDFLDDLWSNIELVVFQTKLWE